MKPYIDENNNIHFKNRVVNISNTSKYEMDEELYNALLKTGEYYWDKGDRFTFFFSEVVHRCYRVANSNYKTVNTSANPCYGDVILPEKLVLNGKEYTDCILEVDDPDGKWSIDLRKGKRIPCPRCKITTDIYRFKKPLFWKIWDFLLLKCDLDFYLFRFLCCVLNKKM